MKKGLLFLVFFVLLFNCSWGQWSTVATDNFNDFSIGFDQVGFSKQGYGAESGGSADKCAYDKNVGSSPNGYVSKLILLESGFTYRFSYYAKRAQSASCGVTLKYDLNTGNGGTSISSEFTPPKRTGAQAGDNFVSNTIAGDGNSYYLKAVVTTGNSTDVKLRIDGFKVERMATLPIKLKNFTATTKNSQNILSWATSSEVNNDYMAIERSADGRKFVELGRVLGAGTSYETQEYSFVDEAPLKGLNYYRLRQVDFDGQATYHKVVSILVGENEGDIRIAPTAVNDQAVVFLPETIRTSAQMNIYDITGKLWHTATLAAGSTQESLNMGHLPNGQYILQVIEGGNVSTVRFNKL